MATQAQDEWQSEWPALFERIDRACDAFIAKRTRWSMLKWRWNNPDRQLWGPLTDGVWGNMHILWFPEKERFRFTFAAWRDEGEKRENGRVMFSRYWSTSDDINGERYLARAEATQDSVEGVLSEAWKGLNQLSREKKFRVIQITLPPTR